MKKVFDQIKNIGSILAAVLIIAVIVVPYILLIFYLRKNGQTIEIYPKFRLKEINRSTETDGGALGNAVTHAEEILKKIRGE